MGLTNKNADPHTHTHTHTQKKKKRKIKVAEMGNAAAQQRESSETAQGFHGHESNEGYEVPSRTHF